MDVSVRTTMKGAARYVEHCALQDSLNQKKVERMLFFRVMLKSLFASVSFVFPRGVSLRIHVFVFSCFYVVSIAWTLVSSWCWTCATLHNISGSDVRCDQAAFVCIVES